MAGKARAAEGEAVRWRSEAQERGEKLANCVASLLAARQELRAALAREQAHECDPFEVLAADVAGQEPLRQEATEWRRVALALAAALTALLCDASESGDG